MATLEDISIRGLDEPSDVDATEKKADNKEKFSIPSMFAKNPFRLIGLTSIDSESVYWCSHDRLASVCSFWTNALSIDPQMIKEETIRIEATDKALVRVLSNFHSTHDCPLYKDDDKWTDVVEVFMLCFMWEYKKGIQLGLDRFAEHRPMTLDCLRSLPYVITQHYPDTNREVFEAHTRAVQNGELVPEYSVKTLNHELAVQVLNSYAGVWEKPYSTDPKNAKVGSLFDVNDTVNKWCHARVIEIKEEDDHKVLKIHYLGWGEKWDEWIADNSVRIRPYSKNASNKEREERIKKYPICDNCGVRHEGAIVRKKKKKVKKIKKKKKKVEYEPESEPESESESSESESEPVIEELD
jgi:hypothetical protein